MPNKRYGNKVLQKKVFFLIPAMLSLSLQQCTKKTTSSTKRFTLLTEEHTGVDFVNLVSDTKEHNILKYANFYGGAGVGIGDLNNDGLLDIYFAGNMSSDKVYLNKGNLQFEDISEKAGIHDDGGWSTGVTLADVDQDGFLDIYVSRELYDERPDLRKNLLYINNGDKTFTEKSEEFGVADTGRTRHATFLDYDNDGLLDLFLLTQPPNPGSLSSFSGAELVKDEYSLVLLKNKGDGFVNVTHEAGLHRTGFPNAVSASDLNNDGWPDLYVANDFYIPDFLFINNQDGTFTNVTDDAFKHLSYYSMGVDVADINNDGQLDVFVLDMVAEDNFRLKSNMSGMDRQTFWDIHKKYGNYQYMFNTLHLNNGNSTFSDVAQFSGMSATDWSWANLIGDFDNDGLKDIYITNGLFRDIRNTDADKKVAEYINQTRFEWLKKHPDGGDITSVFNIIDLEYALEMIPSQHLKNYAYKNNGDLEFTKVSENWGLDNDAFSNGAAYGDLDNDGDLDLVVNSLNDKALIYRNNTENLSDGKFIRLKLVRNNNKSVFGTRVNLYANGSVQTQEVTNVRGIYSTSESIVHFGIGAKTKVDSISIKWPNGRKKILRHVKSNSIIEVNDNNSFFAQKEIEKSPQYFSDITDDVIPMIHEENEFDDFEVQVLLPHKMSRFGPALATADVNGDGLDDIFFGGATGKTAKLMLQDKYGGFKESNIDLLNKEAPFEDVDAVFFDVDGDNDNDLFVVSGGNQFPANDFHYIDRIYLNDGKGNFTKGPLLNANRESGSKAVVSDYDGDGDLDVFVGGRHKPHDYPSPPSSALLVNDGGRLIDKTQEFSPELYNVGLVTDATWTDYDNDQDLDLIVVGEWMPITVFTNEKGYLKKANTPDLKMTNGWWFSIDAADFDQDGDVDFIVGNLGLNYKYKTSPDSPFDVYYDDFDQNGYRDIVLGYYNHGKHFPLRGFSCSSEQIPRLKNDIKKYDIFASMGLNEVYGESNLKNALHYEAYTFASSYIENLGDGNFKKGNLPNMAQLSNINDLIVNDFNDDGKLDVLCIGNLHVSEIETPRNDAGTGLLLLGNGKGRFTNVPHSNSGFFTFGDAKKISSITYKNSTVFMVANNNGKAQFFKWNQNN